MSRRPADLDLRYETDHTPAKPRSSALLYLVILAAAAFVLLAVAYLIQLRTVNSLQGIHDSVNSIQSMDQLAATNRQLVDQLDALQTERDDLAEALHAAQLQLQQTETTLADREEELRAAKTQLSQAQAQLDLLLSPPPEEQP